MKEIKFRAWDGVDYMSEPFDLFAIQRKEISFTEDAVLMQYTGLKDKNGVEIYEGDVVHGDWSGDTYEVELTFNWIHRYEEYGSEPLEVIGNIYENPELLNNCQTSTTT